jgi:hypothetical protein
VAVNLQKGDQTDWKVFIELDFHESLGIAGIGRSSSAETAANAMSARTASRLGVGKSANTSSTLMPSARLANTVLTVTRDPVTTASPPQFCVCEDGGPFHRIAPV